MSIAMKDD